MTKDKPSDEDSFPNDLEFVSAFAAFAGVRCRRIEALREAEENCRDAATRFVGPVERVQPLEAHRMLSTLVEEEGILQAELTDRRACNQACGPALSIDSIAAEFQLDAFDQTVLLLAILPALGRRTGDLLSGVEPGGWVSGGLSVDGALTFQRFNLTERVEHLARFSPKGRLLRHGLIALELGRTAYADDLVAGVLRLPTSTFARLVGLPDLATCDRG